MHFYALGIPYKFYVNPEKLGIFLYFRFLQFMSNLKQHSMGGQVEWKLDVRLGVGLGGGCLGGRS